MQVTNQNSLEGLLWYNKYRDDEAQRVTERVFYLLTGVTICEYIRNRQLSLAGQDLQRTDSKVIDIALKYRYETLESFSKAFSHRVCAEPFCGGILMYERMLNKQEEPTIAQMTAYCGACGSLFTRLNEWLSGTFGTAQSVTFPYGNRYGWGIAHRKNKKLICHVFPEENAFTVMMRLSNKQFDSIYGRVQTDTQEQIDHKYPCGDGGWLHYRVTCREQFDDIGTLLTVKCA